MELSKKIPKLKAWADNEFGYALWGSKINFEFPTVNLQEYAARWDELQASSNPFATVVMAHLKAQETQGHAEERYAWKFNLIRELYKKGYDRQKIINLFHFIDWIMRLPSELDDRLWQAIQQIEEEQRMPYISTVEQRAIKRGLEQGLEQGMEKGLQQGALRQLLRLLHHRFGTVPTEVQQSLQPLAVDQLEQLLDVALTIHTLAEFTTHIPVQES